jgi:hypothetical protein
MEFECGDAPTWTPTLLTDVDVAWRGYSPPIKISTKWYAVTLDKTNPQRIAVLESTTPATSWTLSDWVVSQGDGNPSGDNDLAVQDHEIVAMWVVEHNDDLYIATMDLYIATMEDNQQAGRLHIFDPGTGAFTTDNETYKAAATQSTAAASTGDLYCSMGVRSDGDIIIGFQVQQTGGTFYSRREGSTWTRLTSITTGTNAGPLVIGPDASDRMQFIYRGITSLFSKSLTSTNTLGSAQTVATDVVNISGINWPFSNGIIDNEGKPAFSYITTSSAELAGVNGTAADSSTWSSTGDVDVLDPKNQDDVAVASMATDGSTTDYSLHAGLTDSDIQYNDRDGTNNWGASPTEEVDAVTANYIAAYVNTDLDYLWMDGTTLKFGTKTLAAGPQTLTASPGVITIAMPVASISGSGAAAVTASPGTMDIVGPVASISGAGAVAVTASPGVVDITGALASISGAGAVQLTASPGVMDITGPTATVAAAGAAVLTASPGVVDILGPTASISGTGAATLTASPGVITIVGPLASLPVVMIPNPGVITVSGPVASVGGAGAATLTASPGTFNIAGPPGQQSDTFLVTLSEHDADQDHDGGGFSSSSTHVQIEARVSASSRRHGGWFFASVPIAKDETIVSAALRVVVSDGVSNDIRSNIYGHLTPNPTNFSSTDVTSRALTTANTNWDANNVASFGNEATSPDIAGVISELTSQGTWASGNNIVIIIRADAVDSFSAWFAAEDHATLAPGELDITWGVPAVTVSGSGAAPVTPTPGVINIAGPTASISGAGAASLVASPGVINIAMPVASIATGPSVLTASPGTMDITGPTASVSGAGAATVTASPGVMDITGPVASVAGAGAAPLTATPGVMDITGPLAVVSAGIGADPVVINITGALASISGAGAVSLTASPGVMDIVGPAATISGAGAVAVTASPGVFDITGPVADVSGAGAATLSPVPGVFDITGPVATVGGVGTAPLTASPGVMDITGPVATIGGAGAASGSGTHGCGRCHHSQWAYDHSRWLWRSTVNGSPRCHKHRRTSRVRWRGGYCSSHCPRRGYDHLGTDCIRHHPHRGADC